MKWPRRELWIFRYRYSCSTSPHRPKPVSCAKFEKGLSLSAISIKFIMLALIHLYLIEY